MIIEYIKQLVIFVDQQFSYIPIPVLEIWAIVAFFIGILFAVVAYGGFVFKVRGNWCLARESYSFDNKYFISAIITIVLMAGGKFAGNNIWLVPGAQSLESLYDLAVFLCIVLFGRPALFTVSLAYFILDAIGGFPVTESIKWLPGHIMIASSHWLAYLLIGKDPDFLKLSVWLKYLLFVFIFMLFYPIYWGYVLGPFSETFPAVISYTKITPAIFSTFIITWALAPFAMLIAYPLSRKLKLYWYDNTAKVKVIELKTHKVLWQNSPQEMTQNESVANNTLPTRILFGGPVLFILFLSFGVLSYLSLNSGEEAVDQLVKKIQHLQVDSARSQINNIIYKQSVTKSKSNFS